MSLLESEDEEREESSEPPALRAILPTRSQLARASDVVRVRSFGLEERGRGVVRSRYWASLIAFGFQMIVMSIRGLS